MDPTQLRPGHKLDRYELLCPLAYGGMAAVWLARFVSISRTSRRRDFERLVVVKMILPQYAQDARFQEMFLDEARIASKIQHANVVRILDVGEQSDSTYIVMEWIDGDSLSKVMRDAEQKKQRVPAGVALRICADAASGLHAAHALLERDGSPLGVVHRDVSPQNILISNGGTTVLIDFGVAKARDRVSQDTSAGQLKGKIRYMAPEQALGRDLDHRADIWALGAILYELFSGRSPFEAPHEVAMIAALTKGVAPDPLPESVPESVRAVVTRALSYDPSGRYATALELNLALESALVEIGEPTSVAAVAHYTEHLLADRKRARRRAVDDALAVATARETERTPPPVEAARTSSSPILPAGDHSSAPSFAATQHFTATLQIAAPPRPPAPRAPSAPPFNATLLSAAPPPPARPSIGLGFGESPSAASATLGSAAIALHTQHPAPSRRAVTALVLAVSVIASGAGVALIVSAAMTRFVIPDGGHRGEHVTPASTGLVSSPPPSETVDMPAAPAPSANVASVTEAASSVAPAPSAPAASAASAAPVMTQTRRVVPMPPRAKPAAIPSTAQQPAPAPAPSLSPPGRPDRGF